MRGWLAGQLRILAFKLDGQETINARWHRISVESMNRYIRSREDLLRNVVLFMDGNMLEVELLACMTKLTWGEVNAFPDGPTKKWVLSKIGGKE